MDKAELRQIIRECNDLAPVTQFKELSKHFPHHTFFQEGTQVGLERGGSFILRDTTQKYPYCARKTRDRHQSFFTSLTKALEYYLEF